MESETISDILIFKTNIYHDTDIQTIASMFDTDDRISKWNIDRDDVDHVLRIQSETLETHEVIRLVQQSGFTCEELTD
jgi:hypothetical protein